MRAFARDPDKAARVLGAGVDVAIGNFEDAASIRRALEGVDRVFLTSSNGWREVAHECEVIDAAAEAGVARLVKLSAIAARAGSPVPGSDWHGQIEDHLRTSDVPAVVLRANFLMTNILASLDTIRQGRLFASADTGRISMIDPCDVAAAACACLTTDRHDGHTYLLTGGEAITYGDVASALSEVLGRPVEYIDVPEQALSESLAEAGMPDWLVTQVVRTFELARRGELAQITDWVRTLTGREARSFAQFARDHAALIEA